MGRFDSRSGAKMRRARRQQKKKDRLAKKAEAVRVERQKK